MTNDECAHTLDEKLNKSTGQWHTKFGNLNLVFLFVAFILKNNLIILISVWNNRHRSHCEVTNLFVAFHNITNEHYDAQIY